MMRVSGVKRSWMQALLAAALLIPAIASAQAATTDAERRAVIKAAKDQLDKDRAAQKADQQAKNAACKTPGPACDAAKAKVKADYAAIKADRDNMRKAWKSVQVPKQANKGAAAGGN